VKELKKAHDDKMDKAQTFMKKQAKHDRLQQLETYRKIEEDTLMRDEKIKQANAKRIEEIKVNQEKARTKHERVKTWQTRMQSEEKTRIDSELTKYKQKIENSQVRKQSMYDSKVVNLRNENSRVE